MRAIVSQEIAPRPTNKSITRNPLASAGEFSTKCDCFSNSPSVVMRTMTKMIEGSEYRTSTMRIKMSSVFPPT